MYKTNGDRIRQLAQRILHHYPTEAANKLERIQLLTFLRQRRRWFGGFLPATAFAIVAAKGNIYSGLWYPIVVALITLVIGMLFVKETKDSDIYAKD